MGLNSLYRYILSGLCLAGGLSVSTARADVSWLTEVKDCESFHVGVSKYFGELGDPRQLSPEQKQEVTLVINEACGARFESCKFQICKNRKQNTEDVGGNEQETAQQVASSASAESVGEEFPQGSAASSVDGVTEQAAALGSEALPIQEASPQVVSEGSSSMVALSSSTSEVVDVVPPVKQPFPTDPLAWLEREMDCDEFLEQIRVRYEPLGKFSDLPEPKKEELRTVLSLVCSPRFKHCNYPSCTPASRSGSSASGALTAIPGLAPSKEEISRRIAERADEIQTAFQADRAALKAQIAQKIAEERKGRLEWERFSIQEEATPSRDAPRPLAPSPRGSTATTPSGNAPLSAGNYGPGGAPPTSGGAFGKDSREYSEPKQQPYGSRSSADTKRFTSGDEPERPATKNIPIPAPGTYAPKPLGF